MNAENFSARSELERSFERIAEAAHNAMLMVDSTGTLALVNGAAERLFGYTREELIGQPIELLVPERLRKQHPGHMAAYARAPARRGISTGRELFGRRKNGSEVLIEIGLTPVETPEGLFTLASILDVTERKRAEERFRRVVEEAPNAILLTTNGNTIALVNKMTEEIFGYRRAEMIGQPIEMLVPHRFRGPHEEHIRTFTSQQKDRAMGEGRELYGLRRDGSEVAIEIGLSQLEMPDGPATLVSVIDITERKRAEDELRRSNADLEQFAYIASHDLQEPLRMVASYTELLAEKYQGKLDEKADKYIFFATDGAKRMQQLVSDLLAYSRVGSQGKPLLPVDAGAVLKSVIHGLGALIRDTGATVHTGELPLVLADEVQLRQLFQNLLGNAIKFRGEAPPVVRIEAAREENRYIFRVEDNGIGLDIAYGEQIFQMFQRLHDRAKYEGSGMGLSIAKRIVERHDGAIWLESEPGAGTTFFFTLRPAPTGALS